MPMRASLNLNEPKVHQIWASHHYQQKYLPKPDDNFHVRIYDGPPYANGDIHIGHAVNKVLKDIIARYIYAFGQKSSLIPGWDCHGLPIENMIERKYKLNPQENTSIFINECRQYAQKYIDRQQKDLVSLGLTAYWQYAYHTMDRDFIVQELQLLAQIIDNKHFYVAEKPVQWCCMCQSSLAEAEIEYENVNCTSLYVKFKLNNPQEVFEECLTDNVYAVIWTTTAWTISENQALAINSNIQYAYLYSAEQDEALLVSVQSLSYLHIPEHYQVKFHFLGNKLIKSVLTGPLNDNIIRCYHGDMVDDQLEHSTGIVHLAPAYGLDDFMLLKSHNIYPIIRINKDGFYQANHTYFANQHIDQIQDQVIQQLKATNCLWHIKDIQHQQGHCWRHKTPSIFLCTAQCFLDLKADPVIRTYNSYLQQITFYPKMGYEILRSMIQNRQEWCISRQRYWGVPLPVFINKITHELHPKTAEIIRTVSVIIDQFGIEHYRKINLMNLLQDDCESYILLDYVLDIWFDSGCVPFICNKNRASTSIVIEGRDQYRGWFQSTLLIGALLKAELPCNNIWVHGYIVDAHQKKMSKSKGNVISHSDIIDQYGTDVFRLWIASHDYTSDMRVTTESLETCSNKFRKIRNTLRFLLSLEPSTFINQSHDFIKYLQPIDRHIILSSEQLRQKVKHYALQGMFHQVVQIIYDYCDYDLSAFYINTIRDRQYTTPKNHIEYQTLQVTSLYLLNNLLIMITPIMPYLGQEVLNYLQPGCDIMEFKDIAGVSSIIVEPKDHVFDWDKIKYLKRKVDIELSNQCSGQDPKKLQIILYIGQTDYNSLILLDNTVRLNKIFSCGDVILNHSSSEKINILCKPLPHAWTKCARCWNFVGSLAHSRDVCSVCEEQLIYMNCIN